jgi:hypothetical protein
LEVVNNILVNVDSPIFGKPVNIVYRSLSAKGKLACSRTTLQFHCKRYKEQRVLPRRGDHGLKHGRPPTFDKENIPELNSNVLMTVGRGETSQSLNQTLIALSTQLETSTTPLAPKKLCRETQKLYFFQANTQPGIQLVPRSSCRSQGKRRETAALSYRNVMSQVTTLLAFNFIEGNWSNKPDNLPTGAQLAHSTIENAMGCPMKPVHPSQVINYDFTSYYTGKL